MNFSYRDSVAPVAEDLNPHKLISARGDDFEANAVSGLLDCLAGLGVVDPVGVGFFVGAAEDGLFNGLDWDVELILVHAGSL